METQRMSDQEQQPVWNTAMPVVHLVAAATAEEADEKLAAALRKAGFDLYEGDREAYPTFESEDGVEASPLPGEGPEPRCCSGCSDTADALPPGHHH
jgi:hypothetical protein